MRSIRVALDRLAAEVQPHETAPEAFTHSTPFNTLQGSWQLVVNSGMDGTVFGSIQMAGHADVQSTLSIGVIINACTMGAQPQQLAFFSTDSEQLKKKQDARETAFHSLCTWSELRRPLLEGCALHATVLIASGQLGMVGRLAVPPSAGWCCTDVRMRLPADVTLCVGGNRFGCHKAVLAAVSPVFLNMFSSSMHAGGRRRRGGSDSGTARGG